MTSSVPLTGSSCSPMTANSIDAAILGEGVVSPTGIGDESDRHACPPQRRDIPTHYTSRAEFLGSLAPRGRGVFLVQAKASNEQTAICAEGAATLVGRWGEGHKSARFEQGEQLLGLALLETKGHGACLLRHVEVDAVDRC